MVDERSDVKFPLWRKKVDSSLFQHSMTVIPEWVKNDVFDIVEIFSESSKKHPSSKVIVEFIDDKKSSTHDGWVTTTKFREKWAAKRKPVMRFSFDARLTTKMQNKFSMSYARDVERKRKEYKVSEIEAEMPFYEFLDIEWDKENRKFLLRPHFRLEKSNILPPTLLTMPRQSSSIGDLGFEPGLLFENRQELSSSGIHRPVQPGIWNAGGDYAVSIIVSGGYIDDHDDGESLLYTGQGGRNEKGRHVTDQELTRGNLGLFNSMKEKVPVRVTRGYQAKFGPDEGYRYDGLYVVNRAYIEPSRDGPFIWRFELSPLINSTDNLLWQKELTKTDAQRQLGNQTGDLRLTKANFFKDEKIIDHTTYFRNDVFGKENWNFTGKGNKEVCNIRAEVSVLGRFNGRTKFTISHRPSGEADQGNYTTGLRWGSWMNHILTNEIDCTGRTFQLLRIDGQIVIKII
jgi:hypothetical protein